MSVNKEMQEHKRHKKRKVRFVLLVPFVFLTAWTSSPRERIRSHLDLVDLRSRGSASFVVEYGACARCRPDSVAFPARIWVVDASIDVFAEETHRVWNMAVHELTIDER